MHWSQGPVAFSLPGHVTVVYITKTYQTRPIRSSENNTTA